MKLSWFDMTGTVLARPVALMLVGLTAAMLAADAQGTASKEQLPPVYFNHSDIVLDPALYGEIAKSDFLKEEFSYFAEPTVYRSDTDSFTFLAVTGKRTYLAIFKLGITRLPENQINFNMWINERAKLPLIRDSLARKTHLDATLSTAQRRISGTMRDGFDVTRAVYPTQDGKDVRTGTSVISVYPGGGSQCPGITAGQHGITREIDQFCRFRPERLLGDITRFTVTVSETEAERLQEQFEAYGYAIRRDGAKRIVNGPEIEFVLLISEPGLKRKLAIDMKLNRAKIGTQNYQFGGGSELSFKGDTATWYFPAGWRP